MCERDFRQLAIGLTQGGQQGFIEADEITTRDRHRQGEGIETDITVIRVEIRVAGWRIPQVIPHEVPVTGDIRGVVAQGAQHVEIRTVVVSGVVEPVAAPDMMIGIEAAGAVVDRQAKLDHVAGNRTWVRTSSGSVTAGLEAVRVAPRAGKVGVVAGEKGPAMIKGDRGVGIDTIVIVIAVEPGTASPENIVRAAG